MPEDRAVIDMKLNAQGVPEEANTVKQALQGIGETGKEIGNLLQIFTRMTGIIGIVSGAVGVLAGAFQYLDDRILEAQRRGDALDKSFGSVLETFRKLNAKDTVGFADLDKRIADIKKLREDSNKLFTFNPSNERDKDRNAQLEAFQIDLAKQQDELEQAAIDRKANAQSDEREKAFQDAQRDTDALAQEALSEEAKIEQARELGIRRARVLRQQAEDEFQREVADNYEEQVRAKAERDYQALREKTAAEEKAIQDAADDRERKEREANQRISDDLAEKFARAINEANQGLSQAINQTNSKLTITAENILRRIEQIYANQPSGGGR